MTHHTKNLDHTDKDNISYAVCLSRSLLRAVGEIIEHAHKDSKVIHEHIGNKRENLFGKASLASIISELVDTDIKIEKHRPPQSQDKDEPVDPREVEIVAAYMKKDFSR